MKKFILPAMLMAFSLIMVSCDDDEIEPCEDWWVSLELDEGAEFLDVDDDGEPDGITYMDGDETITIICSDEDLDADCIPDCYEMFMDGEFDDGEEEEEEEDDDDGDDGEEDDDDDDDDEVGPCDDWWIGLELVDGAVFTDVDGDGEPDVLTYEDGDDTISIVCLDDLDGDCIPDCYEEYIL